MKYSDIKNITDKPLKAEVVDAIREFIPNFEHKEKGKNLDSKM